MAGLKTRDLAREIGCANGAVYNLVADVDELILRVGSRTLLRLDKALSAAESAGEPSPQETLVRIALAYCDFAAENLELWRALFEHRMAPSKLLPDWSIDDQLQLFRHIYAAAGRAVSKTQRGRARHHRAQPVLGRAWHGGAGTGAEAGRGTAAGAPEGNRGPGARDDRRADRAGGVEAAESAAKLSAAPD